MGGRAEWRLGARTWSRVAGLLPHPSATTVHSDKLHHSSEPHSPHLWREVSFGTHLIRPVLWLDEPMHVKPWEHQLVRGQRYVH